MKTTAGKTMLHPIRIIVLGFVALILFGSVLLVLPFASRNGHSIPYLDALFTSASAACVTGLVVYDTYTQFTLFGQLVILLLIQIGGLGFMTIATLALMVARRKIGLTERRVLSEAISAFQLGGVVRLVKRILICTLISEGTGAVLLSIRFCSQFGFWRGAYYAIFHSVSAFCNAGFDLMGCYAPYSSFVPYQTDILINLTMMALIIAGGLGFVVWDDIFEKRRQPLRYKLHTKIVLIVNAALIVAGTLIFLFAEYDNTLAGLSGGQKLLVSLFQSVTPRTAGFNTIDTGAMTGGGTALTIILMIIGASPGSTGGGLKTTTFTVFFLATVAYLRNTEDMNAFQRRLEKDALRRAYGVATIYSGLVAAGFIAIMLAQDTPFKDTLFESVSAISTVGLTTGLTRILNSFSKGVLILLMFAGRIGSLSLVTAFIEHLPRKANLRNPEEKIIIG
jgi:trk system potassium uptake protein TrkH